MFLGWFKQTSTIKGIILWINVEKLQKNYKFAIGNSLNVDLIYCCQFYFEQRDVVRNPTITETHFWRHCLNCFGEKKSAETTDYTVNGIDADFTVYENSLTFVILEDCKKSFEKRITGNIFFCYEGCSRNS